MRSLTIAERRLPGREPDEPAFFVASALPKGAPCSCRAAQDAGRLVTTLYDVLGIAPTATAAQSKTVYSRLSRRYHLNANQGSNKHVFV
jgi:hypothetical protein